MLRDVTYYKKEKEHKTEKPDMITFAFSKLLPLNTSNEFQLSKNSVHFFCNGLVDVKENIH